MAKVTFDTGSAFGAHLRAAINLILTAKAEVKRAYDAADLISGTGANTAALEGTAPFNVTAGDGATFWTYLASLKTSMEDSNLAAFVATLDQG